MNFEQFKAAVADGLSRDIPDPKTVNVRPVIKNNGVRLEGLTVLEGESNYSPTIYLDGYFMRHKAGVPFDSLYNEILKTYRDHKTGEQIDTGFFMDYGKIRGRLAYKLIHAERNAKLLKEIPHIAFLDLAIVFYCLLDHSFFKDFCFEDTGTVLIHNSHLELWNVDRETLLRDAHANTPRMLPVSLRDIRQVLDEYATGYETGSGAMNSKTAAGRDTDETIPPYPDSDDDFHILVLTNQKNLFGAACILYDNLLQQIADRMQTDLIILPSSVHEVLLLPVCDAETYPSVHRMVEDVNEAALLPEEILADHAYYYSRQQRRIMIEAC